MAGEVVVDALPYYDQGYDDPGVREAAKSLVEEEIRRYRPTKNYLDYLPPANYEAYETEILRAEFERVENRLPMDLLSMKRYELPQPPVGKQTDIAAWNECVDNSHAQLEHQALRIVNLELMSQYGADAWKMHNNSILRMVESAQKQLAELRKKIQEINWQRKNEQKTAGEKLKSLEESWVSLVSKNYEIEQACVELEQDIYKLQDEQRQRIKKQQKEEKRKQEGSTSTPIDID